MNKQNVLLVLLNLLRCQSIDDRITSRIDVPHSNSDNEGNQHKQDGGETNGGECSVEIHIIFISQIV